MFWMKYVCESRRNGKRVYLYKKIVEADTLKEANEKIVKVAATLLGHQSLTGPLHGPYSTKIKAKKESPSFPSLSEV